MNAKSPSPPGAGAAMKHDDWPARSPVVELRQYLLHPGKRDELVAVFDREFLEGQEAHPMRVIAQFRDLDRADYFVWLRGFPDVETRAKALNDFYTGPVWKANAAAANATMIDSDNVLLLKPARPGSGFPNECAPRAEAGATNCAPQIVTARIWNFSRPLTASDIARLEAEVLAALAEAGASVIGFYVTEPAKNTVAWLPVREGENVAVFFSLFADETAEREARARLEKSGAWSRTVERFARDFSAPPELLRLSPTARARKSYLP